jgi:hypothetical protein
MRVVPFDVRSVVELVGSAAAPFVPLADLFKLQDRVRKILELLG